MEATHPDTVLPLVRRWLSKVGRRMKARAQNRSEGTESMVVGEGFSLVRYENDEGQFDYERYRKIQEEGNVAKLDRVWADHRNIEIAASVVARHREVITFGICHGTRRGLEQRWFREFLGGEIIGTEISSTASAFEHTIQWDFHQVRDEWIAAADFIYSNSWDHSYDPELCIKNWMHCLRPGGVCLLEHSSEHESGKARPLDPFRATLSALTKLIDQWGEGQFRVLETLPIPCRNPGVTEQHLIVVGHALPISPSAAAHRE